MNRKHFVYASLAILIAIYIGMHLSSALAEAQWRRCPIVSKWRLTCTRGGWVWGSNLYRHVNMGQSTISGSQPPTLVQQERLRQHSPA